MSSKKIKFNVFDYFVFFLIIASAIASMYILYSDGRIFKSSSLPVEYVLLVEGIDETFANNIKTGDIICENAHVTKIGQAEKVEVTDFKITKYDPALSQDVEIVVPEKKNIKITVMANASLSGNRYSVNGYIISAGTEIEFRVPDLVCTGKCIEFKEISVSGQKG